jgi:putative glycosyltransferase (TIGR04372 family)
MSQAGIMPTVRQQLAWSAHRGRKGIITIRKDLRTPLTNLARRLKTAAADRSGLTATCLLSIRDACLWLSGLLKTQQDQPDAVPAWRERTDTEVASRSAGNLDEARPSSIAAPEPPAPQSTAFMLGDTHAGAELAPVRDAADIEPTRPGLAPLNSPEEQSVAPSQRADPATPTSAEQALAEASDTPAAHERIDLYSVANDVSPARAVTAYMTKVRSIPTYYKRMWLDQTPRSRIPVDLLPSLAAQAEEHLGIHPAARLVGLHVRESGFKAGREVHDVKPEHPRNDAVRNVSIANYLPALDLLTRQGFTIVRIGDPTMTPLEHPGVVDLARSPARSDLLEAYCIARSACFIGCESGPVVVACMFRKPHLVLNATDPLAVIPIAAGGIFTFQAVREIATGRMLSPLDMLFPDYLHDLRNTRVFEYFENGQQDVLAAVKDLLEIVENGPGPETPEQREFRLWALGVGVRMRLTFGGVCKWGPHRGYLGHGRIAASFGRKYIGPHLVAVEATAPAGALAVA